MAVDDKELRERIAGLNKEQMLQLLALVEPELIATAYTRNMAAVRVYRTKPGRKPQPRPCEWCGEEFGFNAMRAHRPRCPKRPA